MEIRSEQITVLVNVNGKHYPFAGSPEAVELMRATALAGVKSSGVHVHTSMEFKATGK